MACIDKLLVRGIRSFSPSEDKKIIICFNTPLTLIVGQNGAGKTTIIECLKYVTTGDMPPNSKGGAFVMDPKIVGEREVKGVVKLKFKDVSGTDMICHRMLQSVQKPKKIETRTVDVSMEKRVNGEKRKITSRCAEIDQEMIAHLGVSKAILNNVIFCHQEDSNWPLSEGKALKQKFDDIFASTRYSKALDSIKKFRQEQEAQCREYSTDLKHLKEEKLEADKLQVRLRETQSKVDAYKAEVTRLQNEYSPVEERLKELDQLYDEVTRKHTKIAELESTKHQLEKQRQNLLSKISIPFTGSREQLQQTADEHYRQLEKETTAMEDCEDQLMLLSREEEGMKTRLNKLSSEHGKLELEDKQHKQRVSQRDTQIRKLATNVNIAGFSSSRRFTADDVQSFLAELSDQRQKLEEKAQKEKEDFLARESKLSSQLVELRDTQSRSQQKLEMKQKELSDKRQQMTETSRQLKKIGSSGAVIDQIELELRKDEQELSEYRSSVSISAMEQELQALHSQKKQLDQTMHTLQHEMSVITQQSSARGALDVLVRDKRNKEQLYQNELDQLETELLPLMGYMPSDEDLAKSLADLEKQKKEELNRVAASVKRDSSDLSGLEAQLVEQKKQLQQKQARLNALERQVQEVCGGSEYKEKLKEVEDELSSTQDNLNTIKGSQAYFKTCIDKVRVTHKCPLCARGYDSREGEEGLIRSINIRLNDKIPGLLPTFEEKLANLRRQQQRLIELKQKTEDLQVVKTEEVPQLERIVREKSTAVDRLKTILKKAEQELTSFQSQLDQLRKLQPHTVKLSQLLQDLKELDRRVSAESSKLGGDTGRSSTVVNRELSKTQMESEEVGRKMDNKRQEISSSQQTIRELEDRIVSREKERLELQKQVQMRQALVSKKEELTTSSETLKREIEAASRQIKPLASKLEQLEKEKDQVQEEREDREDVNHTEIAELKSQEESIRSSTIMIQRYEEKNGSSSALQQCEDEIKSLKQSATEKSAKKKSIEERKEMVMKQKANAQVRQRELQDNLDLLDKQAELEDTKRKVEALRDELRRSGLDQYDGEYQRLQAEAQRLLKEKASAEGQRQGQETVRAQIQRNLQSDLFRNVNQSHREMVIMLKTTQMANSDLDKYYKALDRAIMKFHSMKMEEINKTIKELWMKTYKGGDIDTIEIRSDDELEEPGTIRTRRIYHYRVVMVKGGMSLDMRGRCSAGQKVLASIIIRLALAETFCLNCGLLALDEPTTNLDSDNISGLAEALADILRERSRQKNFQLIIITHDVQFVELIGRSDYVDDYYLVQKAMGEPSTVRKCPISELPHFN